MDAYRTSSSIFSHRKSSTTKLDKRLTNKDTTADVHETLPNRSTDLQSSWILSSRPTNHFSRRGQAWKILTRQRLLGTPAAKQNASPSRNHTRAVLQWLQWLPVPLRLEGRGHFRLISTQPCVCRCLTPSHRLTAYKLHKRPPPRRSLASYALNSLRPQYFNSSRCDATAIANIPSLLTEEGPDGPDGPR
jgi:hypothetical protein